MTFAKSLFRGAALAAVAIGLSTSSTVAQNGTNFHVLSNGLDAAYIGIGAGGTQVGGVDGIGTWVDGANLHGNTSLGTSGWKGASFPVGNFVAGAFRYKQAGFRLSQCVLGAPPAGALRFPGVLFIEMDGWNYNNVSAGTNVFGHLAAGAIAGTALGLTTGGVLPYGTGDSSSVSFILSGLPSGATGSGTGVSSSILCLLPNYGLIPSAGGVNGAGTATIIAAASATLPINSTGFCWTIQFTWLSSALTPSSLTGVTDKITGWWWWLTNSELGNQYWAMSTDEMNTTQSQSIVLTGGASGLIAFLANLDLTCHYLAEDPVTNNALQPAGFNGTGTYYTTSTSRAGFPANGGFDMGRHITLSDGGAGGVTNPITSLGNQDPAGSPLPGLTPTVGFVTWTNEDTNASGTADDTFFRLTWVQYNWDTSFGIPQTLRIDAILFFGSIRIPVWVPFSVPLPWPQAITGVFFPFLTHTCGFNTSWTDPDGFPAGTFGIPPIKGSSIHLPLTGLGPGIGVPLAIGYGTTAVPPAGGGPGAGPPSVSGAMCVIP